MPPPSSGGVALIEMLNVLEGYDLKAAGFASAPQIHLMAEAMRRAYADRARYLGDPDFNKDMPIDRLMSKAYAADLRKTIDLDKAAKSSPSTFEWPHESDETTHISVVDAEPQRGVDDLHARAGLRREDRRARRRLPAQQRDGRLQRRAGDDQRARHRSAPSRTSPSPGKRMLSSMTPTIVAKDGKLFMVTGSPGGRTIINTVLETIVDAVDFGMNAQEAVDAVPLPPPVAARRDQLRALRLLARHDQGARAARPHRCAKAAARARRR